VRQTAAVRQLAPTDSPHALPHKRALLKRPCHCARTFGCRDGVVQKITEAQWDAMLQVGEFLSFPYE